MKWFAISIVALFVGCGTMQNLSRVHDYDPYKPRINTFGGVEIDKAEMADGMRILRRFPPEPAAIPATGKVLAYAADTPFSLIGDALTFPYCISAGIMQHYTREQARFAGTYEGDFDRFLRELAESQVPDLEITSPPEPASSVSPLTPALDPHHSAR